MSRKLAILATEWGRNLHEVALARGFNSKLHTTGTTPTLGSTVFARLPQRSPEAGRAWALGHIARGGACVHSEMDLRMYENRAQQMASLADHFPASLAIHSMAEVEPAITALRFPIVSKARFGSSSVTVRALHNKDEAMKEAEEVLLLGGRPFQQLGRVQYGELLWQEFLPGNASALRVAFITPNLGWAFKVLNRAHDWRASGSGLCVPLDAYEWLNFWSTDALGIANRARLRMGSRWCAFDLLWDHRCVRWRIVDVTMAWNMSRKLVGGNYDARVMNWETRSATQWTGADQWDILLDSLEEGD